MSESSRPSMRVNSALLKRYQNQTIRLPCKLIKSQGNRLTVATSDGGQVTINIATDPNMVSDEYYEILGSVVDGTTVKLLQCISLGKDIDMALVDDAIKLMHDSRFYETLFADGES
ncbi:replication factor A protein 3 [Mycena amicta]|nr:replication factor A protein 3 [Mycena amicta]